MWFSIITDVELGSQDKQNPGHKVVECFLGHAPTAVKLSSQLQNCPSPPPLTVVSSRICATLPPDVPILSSCTRTTSPMLHYVTSLPEKVTMEVFRGFVKRNLDEDIAA